MLHSSPVVYWQDSCDCSDRVFKREGARGERGDQGEEAGGLRRTWGGEGTMISLQYLPWMKADWGRGVRGAGGFSDVAAASSKPSSGPGGCYLCTGDP